MGGMANGPAPSPNPRRRNPQPDTTELPAAGYAGPVPVWPLSVANRAEKSAWEDLWRRPQAAAWAQMNAVRTVARYCRALVQSEKRDSSAFLLSEVRQLEDRLGLTPMSMQRLRWSIVRDEVADARQQQPAASSRQRLRAVETG